MYVAADGYGRSGWSLPYEARLTFGVARTLVIATITVQPVKLRFRYTVNQSLYLDTTGDKCLTSQASTSTGTFTDRQIRQRGMVRDQLVRADRTVCHFSAAEPGEAP